jgi:hypothetical protein
MAAQTLPSCSLILTGATISGFATSGIPATGRRESVSLAASLDAGTVIDAYVNVWIYGSDPGAAYPFCILDNEPVRFRQPGGSPLLLQNFILMSNTYVVVENVTAGANVHCTLFNRWQFDA